MWNEDPSNGEEGSISVISVESSLLISHPADSLPKSPFVAFSSFSGLVILKSKFIFLNTVGSCSPNEILAEYKLYSPTFNA